MIDDVFRALADPSRRRLLDRLNGRNGQTLRELCAGLDMARQSVSKHLAVLEAANLVTTVRRGREKLHYLNAAPINEIGERWITRYDRDRVHALADLKRALEDPAVDHAPVVRLRDLHPDDPRAALAGAHRPRLHPALLGRHVPDRLGSRARRCAGTSAASRPPIPSRSCSRPIRLGGSPTRGTPSRPELAESLDLTEDARARLAAEPRSKVTFELEPLGELVKLTVVHDGFEPGSLVASMVSQGWPPILSSLKTLLETGETLPSTVSRRPRSGSG